MKARPEVKVVLVVLVLLVLFIGVVLLWGARAWDRETAAVVSSFTSSGGAAAIDLGELEGLPPVVSEYFRRSLTDGSPFVRIAKLTQTGEFRMGESEDSWRPFTATQYISVGPPAFVWDARIRMAPFLSVRVRDAYAEGNGTMVGRIAGLVPVLDEGEKKELDEGALQRYLAEAAWLPSALLPSSGVSWTAVDGNTAEATLDDSGTRVTLEFRFDEAGDIESVFAPVRFREVDGRYEPTPWEGRFGAHATRNGMRIPLDGEVAWILPQGRRAYWRGRLVHVELGESGR